MVQMGITVFYLFSSLLLGIRGQDTNLTISRVLTVLLVNLLVENTQPASSGLSKPEVLDKAVNITKVKNIVESF